MASGQEKAVFTENLPPPPPFWRQFTEKNIARVEELQSSAQPVPLNLRALVPPQVPSDGIYRSFGGIFNINQPLPSLAAQGQEQLYPSSAPEAETEGHPTEGSKTVPAWTLDRAFYLKKTTRSILLNFLELIGTLAQDPSQIDPKLQHLTTLFLNAHHMLNEYRPHQAREALILMMEEQLEKKKAEIEDAKKMKAKIDHLLETLPAENGERSTPDLADSSGVTQTGSSLEEQEATWAALEDEMSNEKDIVV